MFPIALTLFLAAAPKAGAVQATQLVLDVKPATVLIYVDDKKLGKASKVYTLTVKPGQHKIKLVSRISSQEDYVSVKKGEKKTWRFDMGDSGDKSAKPASDGSPTPSLDDTAAPSGEAPPASDEPAPASEAP